MSDGGGVIPAPEQAIAVEVVHTVQGLRRRYGVSNHTLWAWRKFLGFDTPRTTSFVPTAEVQALDRLHFLTTRRRPWSLGISKAQFKKEILKALDYDFDEDREVPLLERVDRFLVAQTGETYQQILKRKAKQWPELETLLEL